MTQTPTDALRLVPVKPTREQWLWAARIVRELGPSMSPGAMAMTMERLAEKAAPASPLPGGVEALIAELKEARGLLADLMVWFGKYPEFKPNPDYMSGVTEDIAKTRAFLARNGESQ